MVLHAAQQWQRSNIGQSLDSTQTAHISSEEMSWWVSCGVLGLEKAGLVIRELSVSNKMRWMIRSVLIQNLPMLAHSDNALTYQAQQWACIFVAPIKMYHMITRPELNSPRSEQNGQQDAGNIVKCVFLNIIVLFCFKAAFAKLSINIGQ